MEHSQMDFWDHDKKEAGKEMLQQISQLCKDGFKQKGIIDVIKTDLRKEELRLTIIMESLLPMLKDVDMKSFEVPDFGKVVVDTKISVKVPKDPEKKQEFFNYLKEKGVFEPMATIHSATLNSFYNAELEVAREEGHADFNIPGLEPSGEWTKLRFK